MYNKHVPPVCARYTSNGIYIDLSRMLASVISQNQSIQSLLMRTVRNNMLVHAHAVIPKQISNGYTCTRP